MLPPNHFLRPLKAIGTGGAQKCRVRVLQIRTSTRTNRCAMQYKHLLVFYDVVEKSCTLATNFLNFCMAGSDELDLALGAGAVGFEFATGVGSMYTGSGL